MLLSPRLFRQSRAVCVPPSGCRSHSFEDSGSSLLTVPTQQIESFDLAATTLVRNKLIIHTAAGQLDQSPFLMRDGLLRVAGSRIAAAPLWNSLQSSNISGERSAQADWPTGSRSPGTDPRVASTARNQTRDSEELHFIVNFGYEGTSSSDANAVYLIADRVLSCSRPAPISPPFLHSVIIEVTLRARTSICLSAVTVCVFQASLLTAADFEKDVKPILLRRCVTCHGPDDANVRLDTLSTDLLKNSTAAETWHDVLNVLNLGEMPPKDEPQLSKLERDILASWITEQIEHVIRVRKSTGGQVVIRRLNRVEYRNTMRDLLGLDLNYGSNLLPDSPSEDGFTNNGSALRMSALQLESYLESARSAMSRAIVTTAEPDVADFTQTETTSDKNKGNWTNTLGRSGTFVFRSTEFPDEGDFLIRIRARAILPDNAPYPQLRVVLGYRADTQTPSEEVGILEVASTEFQDYEFRGRLETFPLQSRTQSKYPGLLLWLTNAYSDGKLALKPRQEVIEPPQTEAAKDGDKKKKKRKPKTRTVYPLDPDFPKIEIESVSFKAPIFESWPPAHHTRILFASDLAENDQIAYARQVLQRFMRRAFRRPATQDEVEMMVAYFQEVRPTFATFEAAMRETLAMVLVSPDFLYLVEPSGGKIRKLDDHELASRLSYFLWSSMPDDRLFELADTGKLRDRQTLQREVQRLLNNPRSWNFVEHFSDQWLDLAGMNRVAVNPEYYPKFRNELKPHMRQETQHFFNEVLRNDVSALAFLDSDFAMLNQPMAEHYGLSGPRGISFERVRLNKDRHRGGLLAQASVLLANSTGEDSHAILRGVWIRERLLDDPPAPPPPNVPNLNQENRDVASLPLKEQLKEHRENEACARCHRGIDPWGIALEEFDAIGLRREKIHRKSGKKMLAFDVDAKSTLPGGHEVNGLNDLKAHLLSKKQRQFARTLVRRLLAYSLGRSLELSDHDTVDELTANFIESDYKLQQLIQLIAAGDAFGSK
jgi:hypothetical protein